MMNGLRAACQDLRYSADVFCDQQNLYDIQVLSTLGLTQEDVEEISRIPEVMRAEGTYSASVYVKEQNMQKTAQVKAISEKGLNQPYLIEGTLPEKENEIAVTQKYMNETGKKLGDRITFEEKDPENPNFSIQEYQICGMVTDIMDLNSQEGAVSFRSTETTDYTFFVLPEVFSSDIYTAIAIQLLGTEELLCFSKDYEEKVDAVIEILREEYQEEREQARNVQIQAEALEILTQEEEKAREELIQAGIELTEEERAEAEFQSAEARKEIENLEGAQWYLQDRYSLSGYQNVSSDADCIEAIGTAFPVLFLMVAILISLTTMTRMVEEERGLIGTYKALGLSDWQIQCKYVIYATAACVLGGIVGNILGFFVLPKIIFIIFGVMYQIPQYFFTLEWSRVIFGILLFVLVIDLAAIVSCRAEVRQMPAVLMRPKAPKEGSRVLLERITPLWKRMSFLNKVTARNLFRYKKRLCMTIVGIAGCTALLVCGFTIKDTVESLGKLQYEETYTYDVLLAAEDADKLSQSLSMEEIQQYQKFRLESVKIKNPKGQEETVQLMVFPKSASIGSYISLRTMDGKALDLDEDQVFLTYNASYVLGLKKNQKVPLQNQQLKEKEVVIDEIAINYMGNQIYMTESAYEALFGNYEENAALLILNPDCQDKIAVAEGLSKMDGILSASSTEKMLQEFEPAFTLMNMVVYVVIVLAAALAVVVLFTLATTNISERERELATIKVLGFFDGEVHSYVNKETLILTFLGILAGLPIGRIFGSILLSTLKLSSIYLYPTTRSQSYWYAGIMTLLFAAAVSVITNKLLNKIDPVEALKSVE